MANKVLTLSCWGITAVSILNYFEKSAIEIFIFLHLHDTGQDQKQTKIIQQDDVRS